jgi:predicted CopG family antitoxin
VSKTIKVADHVYKALTELGQGKETYSQTVQRLINIMYSSRQFISEITRAASSPIPKGNGSRVKRWP